jgi:uncharacterized small protein (DUF1192 family)
VDADSGEDKRERLPVAGRRTVVLCSIRRWTMALFDDEPRKPPARHEIGQDLSALSLHELSERIALLLDEVERLETAKAAKTASLSAADSFFKSRE